MREPNRRFTGIVEIEEFVRAAAKLMDDAERHELIDLLARQPEIGDVVPGTRGLRKLRWGIRGRGKRGGARVIYYFHNRDFPLYLLTVYAKADKVDLSSAEQRLYGRLVATLIQQFKEDRDD